MTPAPKQTVFFISKSSQIPDGEHFVIITDTSHDDGYGGRSDAVEYTAYLDRAEWEARINELIRRQAPFKALIVKPAAVSISVKVDTNV